MNTLSDCTSRMKEEGFKEDFRVTPKGMTTFDEKKFYKPEQVHIVNFYRFEGTSDPGDTAVLYVIVTDDGVRGTLVDGFGATASEDSAKFITQIHDIKKKIPQSRIDA